MFTAIVRYYFRPEMLEEAVSIWESEVLGKVQEQPGFIGVQLYAHPEGQVLAIGSWSAPEDAQAFMRTGVFEKLTDRLEPMMSQPPEQGPWERRHFVQQR